MRNLFVFLLTCAIGLGFPASPGDAQDSIDEADGSAKVLMGLLKSAKQKDNVAARVQAIMDLADFGPKAAPALSDLLDALQTNNEDLRLSAAVTLAKIGKAAVKPVAELLKAKDADTRLYAAWTLGWIGSDAGGTVPMLLDLMADKNEAVRRKAAFALGRAAGSSEKAIAVLASALADDSADMRQAAGEALVQFGKAAVPALIDRLKEKNANARLQAATTLGDIGSDARDAVPLLKERFLANDSENARHYAQMLAKVGRPVAMWLKWMGGNDEMVRVIPALPALAAGLNDPRGDIRAIAAETLVQLGADGAPVLIDALGGKNVEVRRLAAQTLGALRSGDKSVVNALGFGLADADDRVRIHCINGLVLLEKEAMPAAAKITEALADMHPHVRFEAYRIKALHFHEDLTPSFRKMLQSKTDRVRINAACLMYRSGDEREGALPIIVKALDHDDLGLRMQAAHLLGQLNLQRDKLAPIFIAGLKHKLAGVRMQAAQGLAGMNDTGEVPTLAEALGDPDAEVRQAAALGVQNLGPRSDSAKVVPILAKRFKDGDAEVRVVVLQCAWLYPRAARIFLDALKDSDAGVRRQALLSLPGFKEVPPEFAPALVPFLQDKAAASRMQLVVLFPRFGDAGVPHLGELLKDADLEVRLATCQALERLGPKAAKALPALKAAVQDENPRIRVNALVLLAALGSEGQAFVVAQFPKEKKAGVRLHVMRALVGMPDLSRNLSGDFQFAVIARKPILTPDTKLLMPLLKIGVTDPDRDVKFTAIAGLDKLGPDSKESFEAFTLALKDPSEDVRMWTAGLSAYFGKKSWAPLEAALRSPLGTRYRCAILQHLERAKYRAKSGVPLLIECLNDADAAVRQHACAALRHFGPEAAAALPRLRELTKDASPATQEAARLAVKSILASRGP